MAQQGSCKVPGVPRQPVFEGDYSFNTGKLKEFSLLDYIIFAAVLIISAGIGLYHAWIARKQKAIEEFLVASRSMSAYPVGLSLIASFMSAITMLGTPAEIYNFTTMYFWIGLSYFFVSGACAHVYHPVFYRLKVTSAYEYLQLRFNRSVRTATSCIFIFQMSVYMSLVLYAPSLALHAVTGFTLWGSILSIGIVSTIYTALGGMKAVLWTDSFQFFMMIIGMLAVLLRASMKVGTLEEVWEANIRTNRILFTDFRLDPTVRHSVWSVVIGGIFTWVAIFGVNQAQVQRAVACRTVWDAQIAMWITFPGLCLILYLCCFTGLYMAAFYENCDPIQAGLVEDSNQLLPVFVMDVIGDIKGLPGLFVAGLFSGALSTVSSGLNSISAAIFEDGLRNYRSCYVRDSEARSWSQYISLSCGFICLGLTRVASQLGSILQAALTLYSVAAAPMLGVFSLGMFFPWANAKGALWGLFGSIATMTAVTVGAAMDKYTPTKAVMCLRNCHMSIFDNETLTNMLQPGNVDSSGLAFEVTSQWLSLFHPSYMWYSPIAFFTCIIIGMVASFLTGPRDPKQINPDLIVHLCDVVFPFNYLPESIRKPLRFDVGRDWTPGVAPETTEEPVELGSSFHAPSSVCRGETLGCLEEQQESATWL